MLIQVNRETHPDLFQLMDEEAKQYWTYPDLAWQMKFIDDWFEADAKADAEWIARCEREL
jgi:hypothetical protein